MSLKKSQDFLYFQNKASHYHNVVKAKSKIDTRPPETMRNTIDYHQIKHSNRKLPHLRQFDIKFTNQTMLKRILAKDQSPINKHDTYARYNSFERSFRHRNPHYTQQQRQIQIENKKLRKSIEKAKAMVGSIQNWKKNYDQNVKHSRLISKFTGQKLKDQLLIETQKFLPQRYLKYLENAQVQNSEEKSQSGDKRLSKVHVDQLFILPHFNTPKPDLNPSTSKSKLSLTDRHHERSRLDLEKAFNGY